MKFYTPRPKTAPFRARISFGRLGIPPKGPRALARVGSINITPQVEEAVKKSGIKEGLCLDNAMHITASVFIHDENSMQKGA